jgi:hypothetical protein
MPTLEKLQNSSIVSNVQQAAQPQKKHTPLEKHEFSVSVLVPSRSEATGMNVIVADASLFNIFAHCTLKGKYRAVGTNRATPLMI